MLPERIEILRFGEFELQPRAARLLHAGKPVSLEPRAYDLLVLLAESGGRLVEKEEILDRVWNGAFVTDNALTRAVTRLRKALGDSAKEPRFIETVHTRGYRFLAPVDRSAGPAAVPPRRRALPRRLAWVAAVLAVAAAVVAWPRLRDETTTASPSPAASVSPTLDPRRVAVLPLENLSGEPTDDYFVNGLTEQIISNLAQIPGLRVLARTTSGAYSERPFRVAEIARELGVGTVLEGSARRSGDKLRIHVQLIDGTSEEHLWSREFDRSIADVFEIQSEIATRVAEALHLSISSERIARMRGGPTGEAGAHDAYLRGREAYRKQTRAGNEEAIVLYQEALRIDPDFALAEAGLANAYAQRAIKYGFGRENEEAAIRSAERALLLNPELPEAYKALGIVAYRRDRFAESARWSRRAIELNPSYAEAIFNLSSVLHAAGRWDEALRIQMRETATIGGLPAVAAQLLLLGFVDEGTAVAEKALLSEPFPVYLTAQIALLEATAGKTESARRRMADLRRAYPGMAGVWEISGEVELAAGDLATAATYFERACELWEGENVEALLGLARARWIAGDHAAAEPLFERVETAVRPAIDGGSEFWFHYWAMAAIESTRGNVEPAIEWYRRAVDRGHRRLWPDDVDATFSAVRDDPRFQAELQRMEELVEAMRAAVAAEVPAAVERLLAG